jgi:hypothetical protein
LSSLGVVPGNVTALNLQTFPANLRLSWAAATDAIQYEIRLGATWDTATFVLVTNQLVANVSPIVLELTTGNHTFLIKAIGSSGLYSVTEASNVLNIPQINAPSLSGSAIGNNAILNWTEPLSTWEISYYILKRDAAEIGIIDGTFAISSEVIGGDYEYTVQAVDIVGNIGNESPVITLTLENPIDVVFTASIDSTYNGTYTDTDFNEYEQIEGIVGAIIEETIQEHFDDNSWTDPAEQVSAGYPIWFSPTGTTGTYVEEFDFGSILTDSTINVVFAKLNLYGNSDVTCEIEYSDDDITWNGPEAGTSFLAPSFRYVRITLTFTNDNDESLAFVSGLKVVISTQLVLDSGSGAAVSTDVSGTEIFFNRTFQQVNSITLTPESTTAALLVWNNVGTDSFFVYAFNLAGTRINADFSWKARGIV